MLLLCLPTCTTCKKARAFLDQQSLSYESRDIRQDPPTMEELQSWQQASGLPLKKFFNTSGLQYRALGLSKTLPDMTQDQQLTLLASDGMLVKRPLLIADGLVLVGFREAEWSQRLQPWISTAE